MDNNNNHNGKEIPRDQGLRNGQKDNGTRPVNRIKKNNISAEKEIHPGEPKKIPLNANRYHGNQKKSRPKGQVIKLEDKENKIHPVSTPNKENNRTYAKTAPADNLNTAAVETLDSNRVNTNNNIRRTPKEGFTISDKTGLWLVIAAVLFLIAWAVIFFYYHIGGNSHMLLAFAVIFAVISLAGKRKR